MSPLLSPTELGAVVVDEVSLAESLLLQPAATTETLTNSDNAIADFLCQREPLGVWTPRTFMAGD
jgi:hypothetical protein